jgi:UDP-N-acetylglucosamine--N-acetylmuramyl-(pentapeptide) pyrophosphoryl-undecaprenol N-acetylglucosamine transferase
MTNKKILLAAGGTGGHVFPAYALAEHLLKKQHKVHLITDCRGSSFQKPPKDLKTITLPLRKTVKGAKNKLLMLLSLIPCFFVSLYEILRFKPNSIIGFGGFPSFPTILAAIFLKPFLMHKIILHEQNAVLGRVNRWLLPFVHQLAASFPQTWGLAKRFQKKVCITGNFVRQEFSPIAKKPYEPFDKKDPIRLLIIGGSQGALSFSTIIPAALASLPASLKKRLHVVQQSRPEMLEHTRTFYQALKIPATVESFFPNIATLMEKAHLVISRAGASTVFEVSQAKRPAILIPYPHAMDNHQYFNALVVDKLKGGWLVEETDPKAQETLNALLKALLENPKKLGAASTSIHNLVKENTLACFLALVEN